LTDVEKEALLLLGDFCPNYQELVGSQCAALLNQGQKIEMEAVINFAAGRVSLDDAITQ